MKDVNPMFVRKILVEDQEWFECLLAVNGHAFVTPRHLIAATVPTS